MDAMSFSSNNKSNPSRQDLLNPSKPKLYYGDPKNYGSKLKLNSEKPPQPYGPFGARLKQAKNHLQTQEEEDDDDSSMQSDLDTGRMDNQLTVNVKSEKEQTVIPGNSVHKARKDSFFKRCSTHQEVRLKRMPETGAGLEGGPSMGTDGMSSSGYSLLSVKIEGNDKPCAFRNGHAINHLEEDSVNSRLKRKCSVKSYDCGQKGTTDESDPASHQNMTFNNKLETIITKRTPDFGNYPGNGQLCDMTLPAKRLSHNSAIQRPGGRDPRIQSDFPIRTTYPDETGCGDSNTKTECPIHLTGQDVNLLVQTTDGLFYDKGLIKNGMIYNTFYGDPSCNNNIWAGYANLEKTVQCPL
jgi:hypothetical protein